MKCPYTTNKDGKHNLDKICSFPDCDKLGRLKKCNGCGGSKRRGARCDKHKNNTLRGLNKNQKKTVKKTINMKHCRYCRSTENLTIDHKIPVSQGGSNKVTNLQCLCMRCNGLKSGLSDKQVKNIWKWFIEVQDSRVASGKKPYFHKYHDFNWKP